MPYRTRSRQDGLCLSERCFYPNLTCRPALVMLFVAYKSVYIDKEQGKKAMTTSTPIGSFALVLHAHQPFVLGYGRWPHGSDWLCEAVVESYLPLLRVLRSPAFAATPFPLTMSFSPVLCEQLASPLFQAELRTFLENRLRA